MDHIVPVAFDLRGATNPFTYAESAISVVSNTEAFETGIDVRDREQCIVCGAHRLSLEYAHIVPNVERETWEQMRDAGFIPINSKRVQHEARNGVLMCSNHHKLFDLHVFYIRWIPEHQCFVLINHSQYSDTEIYHGRAVNLQAGDSRVPFHGAFLIHEMRVRGRWPFKFDREIPIPILPQEWMPVHPDSNQHLGGGRGNVDNQTASPSDATLSSSFNTPNQQPMSTAGVSAHHGILVLTNPFANPAELEALKQSFSEQPNWKAAMVENQTWEGTAEENMSKWRMLRGVEA